MKIENRIGIVGAACRLPGAPDEAAFRSLLNEGRFTVSPAPRGRWEPDLLFHPDQKAPGAAYTFAGGYLDNPYDFDNRMFGISPREAIQMDPQQRLLIELVWEALENARIPPTGLVGKEVGVYIGVSALDHANLFGGDPGSIESHFMTGNTLSIVANRISYLYDLKGPSFVVDTACSSSLVAVDCALKDLRSGRVDMAIVGGVNMLLSPAPFVGFSRAQMLSPTGACRPFSDKADGYVRAEGGVVFVIQREEFAEPGAIRALIDGSEINSDGRTGGIALPGITGQRSLLERAYAATGVDPQDLSFVEAHGTGTLVGDPIEAQAIGEVLGRNRTQPLPIGSVKSNVGHLEPASGVTGMMKALIALEQRELPATLHLENLNPHIDFDSLNLAPARQSVPLGDEELVCGVSSFGFGGSNGHVVMRSAPLPASDSQAAAPSADLLIVSSQCRKSLAELAHRYADVISEGHAPARVAYEAAAGRARLRKRAVMPVRSAQTMERALRSLEADTNPAKIDRSLSIGTALPGPAKVCFVYNGNGSQWVGMGCDAYANNEAFRRAFDMADQAFTKLGFVSLAEVLHADDLAERIGLASCVQPLIFGIQHGLTCALAELGLKPTMVLGHSVGEIAAAHASGAIDLEQAARILAARAHCQEAVHGAGGMVAAALGRASMLAMLEELALPDIGIAAENSPSSVTLSGSNSSIGNLVKHARNSRVAVRKLDIEYPYHSELLEPCEQAFREELGAMIPVDSETAFISTVTSEVFQGRDLDSEYWWRNIRREVRFSEAVRTAIENGCNLFVEIGPRGLLRSAIMAVGEENGATLRVVESLSDKNVPDEARDPIMQVLARAVANGFEPEMPARENHAVDRAIPLPRYPWQHKTFAYAPSSAAIDLHGVSARHPLIGARMAQGAPEWRSVLDPRIVPYLADHVVGGEVIVPGAALAEMALAVARTLWPDQPVAVEDFDILHALVLPSDGQMEISVRYERESSTVSIHARPRFGEDEWVLYARGRIAPAHDEKGAPPAIGEMEIEHGDADAIYRKAIQTGLDYGPAFRKLRSLRRRGEEALETTLVPVSDDEDRTMLTRQVIDPARLDAAFHSLFDYVEEDDTEAKTWLPIRYERLVVWKDHAILRKAAIRVDRSSERLKTISMWLYDSAGDLVARLDRALLRAVANVRRSPESRLYHLDTLGAGRRGTGQTVGRDLADYLRQADIAAMPEQWLLLHAHRRAALREVLQDKLGKTGTLCETDMFSGNNFPPAVRQLCSDLLSDAEQADILSVDEDCQCDDCYKLNPEQLEVSAAEILATCIADLPEASADIALAAHAAATLGDLLATGTAPAPRASLLARQSRQSLRLEPWREALRGMARHLAEESGQLPHIVVAAPRAEPAVSALVDLAGEGIVHLSIAAADEAIAKRVRSSLPRSSSVGVIDISKAVSANVDLCIVEESCDLLGDAAAFARLSSLLRTDAAMLIWGLDDDLETRFLRGFRDMEENASRPSADEILGSTAILTLDECIEDADAGLRICMASKVAPNRHSVGIIGSTDDRGLSEALASDGIEALAITLENITASAEALPENVVWTQDDTLAPETLGQGIMAVREVLLAMRSLPNRPRVWLVLDDNPVGEALRGMARVAMNEMPELDTRILVRNAEAEIETAGKLLADMFGRPGDEREWRLTGDGLEVFRLRSSLPLATPAEAVILTAPQSGILEGFNWVATDRIEPGPGEIEIEIAATGLNFRDVMLAMGLLNDDVLEEGLAGAVYGLECAGRVVRIGEGVTQFGVGDAVTGFGQNCFASHIVGPAQAFVGIPDGLSFAAAAGIPVAFYTAWYSLVELARLRKGETVLVHGAAGGVGLAAVQIARAAGAKVIATVSTPDKAALARLYGAEAVYDSRSLKFVDLIRDKHEGVDVVLNSLSGDAMRGSLKCLRPRGRFIELGKRDYVANSQIGLRPFRRNLSYFGVDVDQLLALDPEMTERGLAEVADGFAKHNFLPLPVFVHGAREIGEAFRLMQSAGHVGKIVVSAPAVESVRSALKADHFEAGDGVQLIVGGTSGFGLATALWLAGKGATKIVVASRRGEIDEARSDEVEALRKTGVVFESEAVDVGDRAAVTRLVKSVAERHGPITGVWHTAVTLNDGIIDGLTSEVVEEVLAPKVAGAINLHETTLDQPLSQFVMYSSASALIGNPGQSAYAAANGLLEGLARERRAAGLPALAVAWGALTDVGLLADRGETMETIERVSVVAGMTSVDALSLLDRIMVNAEDLADPVVTCFDPAKGALLSLPVPSSPTFIDHFSFGGSESTSTLSFAEMVEDLNDTDAHRVVLDVLAKECAQILRQSVDDVDVDTSIDNLGMDSLMALELRMTIETRYGLELPMMMTSGAVSLRDFASRVLKLVRNGNGGGQGEVLSDVEAALIGQHGGKVELMAEEPLDGE